ncbi:hypothetical protein [Nocardioides sp. NPDC047086]|uniref:hypothetical protein n=1 Tax=Nocardioides sp. NPDC047086 TaxID=3154810 RepID=UPI0033D977A1
MTMVFWLSNLALSLVFARLSDRTQRRKAFMVGGGIGVTAVVAAGIALVEVVGIAGPW